MALGGGALVATAFIHSIRTPEAPRCGRAIMTFSAGATSPHRDRSIDLVRAVLLVIVVGLHSMMVGISVGPSGFALGNALEHQDWFAPVTWALQVMPLFFLVGGFSSHTQWTRMRERGHSASDYVVSRLHRLLVPAVAVIVAVAIGLAAMTALGVPADLIAVAGFRISQPLWFLGVYVLCSAFVPVLVAAHGKRPVLTLVSLIAAAVAVDVLRFGTGIEGIGFLNLVFVWLAVQQFGFWLADGRFDALSTRSRVSIMVGSILTLLFLTVPGPYSVDMLNNLNPPTICLIVLGVAQLMLFTLLRDRLRIAAERPRIGAVVDALGARSMTVYLWHMPVIIVLAAGLLILNAVVHLPLPEPLSAGWWATRPIWLFAVGIAVLPVAACLGRSEMRKVSPSSLGTSPRVRVRVAFAVVAGAGAVLVLLVTGISLAGAVMALGMLVAALALAGVLERTAQQESGLVSGLRGHRA